MRRAIERLVLMIVIGQLLTTCGGKTGSDTAPAPVEIVQVPTVWGEDLCEGDQVISQGPVTGISTQGGWVWAALLSHGNLIHIGQAVAVDGGVYSIPQLRILAEHDKIPAGEYDVVTFYCLDSAEIGSLSAQRTQSVAIHYTVAYSPASGDCLEIAQGDSVYFYVEDDGFGGRSIKVSQSEVTDYSYIWTAYFKGTTDIDQNYLYCLDGSKGLFFPLKVTSVDKGMVWTIQAYSPSFGTYEAEVEVVKPSALGTTNNDHDTAIAWYANYHAVPVSLFKALIDQEQIAETFDPEAYRYEPCFDRDRITSPGRITWSIFCLYALEIPSGYPYGPLARGSKLVAADTVPPVHVYGGAYVLDDNPHDGFITAYEYDLHHSEQNWPCSQNLDFVAQTTVAGSYGLVQVMWATAYQPLHWNNNKAGNPCSLFVVNTNLFLGAKMLRMCYDATSPDSNWSYRWRDASGRYNGGLGSPNFDYADKVWQKVSLYEPIR